MPGDYLVCQDNLVIRTEFLYSLLSAPASKKSISDPGRTQESTAGLRDRDGGSRGTGCRLPNARCAEKGVSVVSVKGRERREWGRGEGDEAREEAGTRPYRGDSKVTQATARSCDFILGLMEGHWRVLHL